MNRQRLLLMMALSLLLLFPATSWSKGRPAPLQEKTEKTLYERLGGFDAIAALSDEFIKRLASDKLLSRFVVGLSDDSKKKLRQHFVEQICAATGGPCVYMGRDMKTVHTGLGITEKDWEVASKILSDVLDQLKVAKKEKDEVLAFVTSLKKDIVEK
jgi:hemoglobin